MNMVKDESKSWENIKMANKIIKCADCNTILHDDIDGTVRTPCNKCGSVKRVVELFISEEGHGYEMIGLREKAKGIKKPIREVLSGDELFKAIKKWVIKKRIIDRENDRYYEKVEDSKTGEIIHECDEPLSKHFCHGSAKMPEKD